MWLCGFVTAVILWSVALAAHSPRRCTTARRPMDQGREVDALRQPGEDWRSAQADDALVVAGTLLWSPGIFGIFRPALVVAG